MFYRIINILKKIIFKARRNFKCNRMLIKKYWGKLTAKLNLIIIKLILIYRIINFD